jgi:hypothetical protein
MNNYLSYACLAFFGYFMGFKSMVFFNIIYNTYLTPNQNTFYRLYIGALLYFYGFSEIIYLYMLYKLYGVVCNYDSYVCQLNGGVIEYNRFMEYYDSEIVKNPEKTSMMIEKWKKTVVLYNSLHLKYNKLQCDLSKSRYYGSCLRILNYASYYGNITNEYLDIVFIKLKDYFVGKIDISKYTELLDSYKNRELENNIISKTIDFQKSDTDLTAVKPVVPNFEEMDFQEMIKNMPPPTKDDLENFSKLMSTIPQGVGGLNDMKNFENMMKSMPSSVKLNDMKNFENMMKSMPDMNEFLTTMNNSTNSNNVRKINKKKK